MIMTNNNIKTKSGSLQKMTKKKSSQEQDKLAHGEHCNTTAELPLGLQAMSHQASVGTSPSYCCLV